MGRKYELAEVERLLDGPYASMSVGEAAARWPRITETWVQWCDGLTYDQALKHMESRGRPSSGLVRMDVELGSEES